MPAWSKIRGRYLALRDYVYLDTAATGVMSRGAARAARQFYDEVARHGNSMLDDWLERMEGARRRVAALIGASPEEVAFAPNTSFGMNIAALMLKGCRCVVTNDAEFPASTVPWLHHGYKVRFVKTRKNITHLEDIKKAVGRRRRGVIVHSYVQYASGFRQDMVALGELARSLRHYFVANITQGCGAFPVDVRKWGVDIACCTGVKWLCAGEGAGFIYIRRDLLRKLPAPLAGWFSVKNPMSLDNRAISLKDEASRFELGGPAFPNIFALGSAVKEIHNLGVKNITGRIYELTDYLLEELSAGRMTVASPKDNAQRSGIVLVKAAHALMVVEVLRGRGVRVSERKNGIRVSVHFYNNHDDIDRLVYHLKKLV